MLVNETVSHYRILELLGAGGMGEVYKAEDLRLKRTVALKVLPLGLSQDRESKERLILEAQAASALDHPNICTIHEVDQTPDGRLFIAMAYYDGETLRDRVARGPLAVDEALDVIAQAARGVAAAHDAGIVHRDIKPANIVISKRGDVKLLDFGIAKLSGQTALTRTGTTLGTVAYMAPEAIAGQGVDARADVWALGVVLYQMLAGRLPFDGDNDIAILKAIVDGTAPPLRSLRPDVPAAIDAIVAKALRKEPRDRYDSAKAMLADLEPCRPSRASSPDQRTRPPRRLLVGVLAVALITASVAAAWLLYRAARVRSARQQGLPEFAALLRQERFDAAYRLMRRIEPTLADDPEFVRLRGELMLPVAVKTDPPGAELFIRGYSDTTGDWLPFGRSPLETRGPNGFYRWRVTKPGYETFEGAEAARGADLTFVLTPTGAAPDGMVFVPGRTVQVRGRGPAALPAYWIDRYEVTNRSYKKFVDAGGYRSHEYWVEPFVKDGTTRSWEEAMVDFRDATGRPGPATWELGAYPEGQDDYPVHGISWYEAHAFAKYVGKEVPTVYHWRAAAAQGNWSDILYLSNFNGKGPARVGSYQGIGRYGTYDMAGNVKEWCWNEVGERRYIMGGAWNEPNYQYRQGDARQPFDRQPGDGLRLVKSSAPVPVLLREPIERLIPRDYTRERPVSDDTFQLYKNLFAYDHTDLKPQVESSDDSATAWRVERVSFAAAYGSERISAYIFLPKNASPPYQTVVYFPHSGGLYLRSFEVGEMGYLGFLVKAGRALVLPMYKGMYERRSIDAATGPNAERDLTIQQMKDLSRAIDYLQTRPDIDRRRLAFFGVSYGGFKGPIALAVEPRFTAAVLWSAGLSLTAMAPEIDPFNFAPRAKAPVLVTNGRDDFTFPEQASQLPLFRLLGAPDTDKKRVVYEGGHIFPFARIEKDTLDWLDHYLGVPK